MSKESLPSKVDPFRFADNATCLHGFLYIKDMQRLCENLQSDKGSVEVSLQFDIDEFKIPFLKGNLESQLNLQCQRCLEVFDYKVIDDFTLGIVRTEEQANILPAHYDPLIIQGSELFIRDVIEDELIISLPIVAMHEPQDCKVKLPLMS